MIADIQVNLFARQLAGAAPFSFFPELDPNRRRVQRMRQARIQSSNSKATIPSRIPAHWSSDRFLNSETTPPMCLYNTESFLINVCFVIIIIIIIIIKADIVILQSPMHNIHKAIVVTKLVNASIIGTFITANRDFTVHCELPLH